MTVRHENALALPSFPKPYQRRPSTRVSSASLVPVVWRLTTPGCETMRLHNKGLGGGVFGKGVQSTKKQLYAPRSWPKGPNSPRTAVAIHGPPSHDIVTPFRKSTSTWTLWLELIASTVKPPDSPGIPTKPDQDPNQSVRIEGLIWNFHIAAPL